MIKEMKELINKLAINEIPFQVVKGFVDDAPQIFIPEANNPKIDFVCHSASYGGNSGLMECMDWNNDFPEIFEEDNVIGWLNCDDAWKIVKKVMASD